MILDDNKLTQLLYLSKVAAVQQCPMRYFWGHHCHLQPKDKPSYFGFGSGFHKVVEIGHLYGFDVAEAVLNDVNTAITLGLDLNKVKLDDLSNLSTNDKELMLNMLDAFVEKWQLGNVKQVLSTEYSVKMPLAELGINSNYFTDWVVKADFIFQDEEGLWVGDLKTTSGYGAATAKYYHSSPQSKTYFHVLKKHMPALRGTKIFVVTKQKIRCEVETILMTQQDHYQAQLFMEEAVQSLDRLEMQKTAKLSNPFSRAMTSCISHLGSECPYIPICINSIKDEGYAKDLIDNWFKIESPDKHLELD